jgi:hypothetical protein
LLLWLVLVLFLVVGCGGGEEPTPVVIIVTPPPPQAEATVEVEQPGPAQPGIQILEATFAHGLSEEMQPVDPGADFGSGETIHLSLKIKGRPEEGLVVARFFWHESLIAEASVDLADVNSGLLFSIGEDTYAGYTLTHDEPFPVSDRYYAEVLYNGQPLGSYPFRVMPPADAIPSQVSHLSLALGADENYDPVDPTTTFRSDQTVFLVGRGDFGLESWLQADWYVNGQLDSAGTRSLALQENAQDVGFAFSYLPEGGWPVGDHYVVLTLNDQELGRYTFTIVSSGGAVPLEEAAF